MVRNQSNPVTILCFIWFYSGHIISTIFSILTYWRSNSPNVFVRIFLIVQLILIPELITPTLPINKSMKNSIRLSKKKQKTKFRLLFCDERSLQSRNQAINYETVYVYVYKKDALTYPMISVLLHSYPK